MRGGGGDWLVGPVGVETGEKGGGGTFPAMTSWIGPARCAGAFIISRIAIRGTSAPAQIHSAQIVSSRKPLHTHAWEWVRGGGGQWGTSRGCTWPRRVARGGGGEDVA